MLDEGDQGAGASPRIGLVLPGGGARGAYQAGVLKGIAEMVPPGGNPFPVLSGVSVGAINAAAIACASADFAHGAPWLAGLWAKLGSHDVYRTDPVTVGRTGLKWMLALLLGGLGPGNPRAFLDTDPLIGLLSRELHFDNIAADIEAAHLHAVAVTASSYATGRAVSFFQAAEGPEEWERQRRDGIRTALGVEHIMASTALPFVFPARRVGREYFGDGALRLATPLSPAIRLGADRILVVAVRDPRRDYPPQVDTDIHYPSIGDIGAYALDILASDNLDADVERAERINHTLGLMTPEQRAQTPLRPVEIEVMRPSRDVREIALRHLHEAPFVLRMLMRGLGAEAARARLASFLMFESGFIGELIDLGYQDALAHRDTLLPFLGLETETQAT